MRVNENILISSLTTMRLGGPARYVYEIEKPEEIPDAYGFAKTYNLPVFVLGGGANTIGHDEGFNGVIIINRMRGITDVTRMGDDSGRGPQNVLQSKNFEEGKESAGPIQIKVMGGEPWDNVCEYATSKGLSGIEGLSKIPGLAGAAPVQNIGAYGQEISDTLTEIDVYDSETNSFRTLSKEDLQFSYRKSILNTTAKNRYFVISITLTLQPGQMPRPFYDSIEKYVSEHNVTDFSPANIRKIISEIRASKIPDPREKASAGSFFKNIYLSEPDAETAKEKGYPVYKGKNGYNINSGWLIEQAGFKGELLHGIRVNEKASLILINESATSYNDLAKARDEIIAKVYDKFGYWLEQEPVEITNENFKR